MPSSKELKKLLQTENPDWKLPERRVSKFLRKALKAQGKDVEYGTDDADESVTSAVGRAKDLAKSTSRKIKNLVSPERKKNGNRNLFSFLKKSSKDGDIFSAVDAPPPVDEVMAVAGTIQEDSEKENEEETESPYHDDNDGKKQDQLCADACVIL